MPILNQKMVSEVLSLNYPFQWQGLENFRYSKDERGIPCVNMGRKWGLQYNPITIIQFGLYNLQRYAQYQGNNELIAIKQVGRWLEENFKPWHENMGAWIFQYDLYFYGPRAPWISAMAQGQGISFLLRFYSLQPEEALLEICQKAFRAFLHPMEKGGVVSKFPDGAIVFEEFPTEPPPHVLNGHIFALLGIHDFARFFSDNQARRLFEEAIKGLKQNLHRYDTGYWNLYDLHPTRRLASPMYMKVHIQLMEILYEMTGEMEFQEFARRCQMYLKNPICRIRWFFRKIHEKVKFS